ncbi:MAG TPA: hypothetical protein VLX56_05945 [Nitrososphaerales archaeon]|nr:hypothetical protein [Nitrososphaerales archaeon]
MARRLFTSFVALALLVGSLGASSFYSSAAMPNAGSGPASGISPNATVIVPTVTVTTTSVSTVTVTSIAGPVVSLDIHVVDQNGLWINGALVDVFQQQADVSPPAYTLVASGTTNNGRFLAVNVTAYATFNVQVYPPLGGSANQTVTTDGGDQILTFVIPNRPTAILAIQNVSLTPSNEGSISSFSLTADVVNVSNSTAYDAVLTLTPPSQFSILNTGSTIAIGVVGPGGSKTLNLTLSVSSTAAPSTTGYTAAYSLTYDDYSGTSYTVPGTISLPSPLPPSLVLRNVVLSPAIVQPGISFSLSADVVNVSNSTAYNAVLALNPPSQFSILNTGSTIPIGVLAPGSAYVLNLTLSVSSSTVPTGYTIPYSLAFTDYFFNKLSTVGNLFVPVSGNSVHPDLILTSASFVPPVVHPGDNFAIQMKVENTGFAPAEQAVLSVNASSPISTVGSVGNYRFGNVGPNGTTTQTVAFTSPDSTKPGSYPLTLTLSYVDNLGAVYTTQQVMVVNIVGQPSIVFNSLQFGKNPLIPGLQTFLNAQLFNSGGASALGVKVTFSGGPPFLSNITIYLGSIQGGVTGNATAFLSIPSDARLGEYNFNATVTYGDSSGASYKITSPYTVTIAPYATPQVSITNTLLSPAVLTPGSQGTFTMYLRNDGSSPAYNTTVSVQNGDGIFTSALFGLGTIDGSTSQTAVTGINVKSGVQAGNYLVKILVTYTDQNNVPYNFTLPLEMTVYSTTNLLSFKNVGFGVGAVIIVVVAYFLVRRYVGTRST